MISNCGTEILELQTRFGTTEHVTLSVSSYLDNKSLYVGMMAVDDGFPEPYGNVTVNLSGTVPAYCAYIDINNMPEAEGFLVENGIAEFTGMTKGSGFCTYPLYCFDLKRMRELCPDGMLEYEQENGLDQK